MTIEQEGAETFFIYTIFNETSCVAMTLDKKLFVLYFPTI